MLRKSRQRFCYVHSLCQINSGYFWDFLVTKYIVLRYMMIFEDFFAIQTLQVNEPEVNFF